MMEVNDMNFVSLEFSDNNTFPFSDMQSMLIPFKIGVIIKLFVHQMHTEHLMINTFFNFFN